MRQDTFAILPNMNVTSLLVGLFFVFLLWGAIIAWRWMATRRDAADIYAAKREHGELADHVTEAAFTEAYIEAEAPRAAAYFYLCALACALLVPPVMGIFSSLWHEVWTLLGEWPPTARGTLVHTFSVFLITMATMVGVLALAMHRFHSRAPQNLRQAIQQLNGANS